MGSPAAGHRATPSPRGCDAFLPDIARTSRAPARSIPVSPARRPRSRRTARSRYPGGALPPSRQPSRPPDCRPGGRAAAACRAPAANYGHGEGHDQSRPDRPWADRPAGAGRFLFQPHRPDPHGDPQPAIDPCRRRSARRSRARAWSWACSISPAPTWRQCRRPGQTLQIQVLGLASIARGRDAGTGAGHHRLDISCWAPCTPAPPSRPHWPDGSANRTQETHS